LRRIGLKMRSACGHGTELTGRHARVASDLSGGIGWVWDGC